MYIEIIKTLKGPVPIDLDSSKIKGEKPWCVSGGLEVALEHNVTQGQFYTAIRMQAGGNFVFHIGKSYSLPDATKHYSEALDKLVNGDYTIKTSFISFPQLRLI